jgi:hypothetical protein
MAGLIDTEAVPGDSAERPEGDRRVPAYKLVAGVAPEGLSVGECRYLASGLFVIIPRVVAGEVEQASDETLKDLKAKHSEFLGGDARFVRVEPLRLDAWERLMNRFQSAIGWASEDGGLVVDPS